MKNPYSLAWNAQVDHEVTPRLVLRLGYEERSTRRDFVLEPIADTATLNTGRLLLINSGRSRYRKLVAFLRSSRSTYWFMKGLSIPFRGKKYRGRAGMTIFNITNHWNPRDVQNNLDSRQFRHVFQQSRFEPPAQV